MPYNLVGGPLITFDEIAIEKQVAAIAQNNGITNQAGWDAFVASIGTLPQAIAVCKGLLGAMKFSAP